jgi:recombinational DNA repair protein RecR
LVEPLARLIDEFKKLPSVGSKTAQRFLHFFALPTKTRPPPTPSAN